MRHLDSSNTCIIETKKNGRILIKKEKSEQKFSNHFRRIVYLHVDIIVRGIAWAAIGLISEITPTDRSRN